MLNLKKSLAASLALVVLSLTAGRAAADVVILAPSRATVLPNDGSGLTKIVLQYDLSGLRTGEGRQIDEAMINWHLAGVSSSHDSDFSAYQALVSWTSATAVSVGVGRLESGAQPISEWEFTTVDYDRNDGGFVRFDLRELASAWASGASPNYGILIITDDVSRTHAAAGLDNALLTVRYGFSK